MDQLSGARIHITGTVQGVGFRPFVFGLAASLGLSGWVRNTSAGVDIEVDGPPEALHDFTARLRRDAPPLASIDSLTFEDRASKGYARFEIVHSQPVANAFQPVSPDVSICSDCLAELRDPTDRRYHYAFNNCTNCGPRFTIIADIPYDRPNTTLASFGLCPDCAQEYANPLDRRFHAQPVACPRCGPHLWLEDAPTAVSDAGQEDCDEPPGPPEGTDREVILQVQRLLKAGKILAIKGLGGFHLACDAANPQAVAELRRRKLRVDKPFALMMPDIETIEKHCLVSQAERELLQARERPIVILEKRAESAVVDAVAPFQLTLGVMLPYTPLHYLLFEPGLGEQDFTPLEALVMTSGNLSEEPIVTQNSEARQRLAPLADAFLMHNRPIQIHCDDSVLSTVETGSEQPGVVVFRRGRGFAPAPLLLPWDTACIFAAGADLKSTFCLTRERYAFLSHHIGELENFETLTAYENGIDHFEKLFRLKPVAIAHDLHPNYLSTRFAQDRAGQTGLPITGVQHHHAHIAACLADNHLPAGQVVIGVAFDGTGYGDDGAIWGGEFLLAGCGLLSHHDLGEAGYRRLAHLAYQPLPGGDAAIRHPARTALAYLWKAGIDWDLRLPSVTALTDQERAVLRAQLERSLNTPLTSSMGRLFDAAAALVGVRQLVNYEAQAAIELEALADPKERGAYPFDTLPAGDGGGPFQISLEPLLAALLRDIEQSTALPVLSARFHNGIAQMVVDTCNKLRQETGAGQVALSGGVWQNRTLLRKTVPQLEQAGFLVYTHRRFPANDGAIALGQALIASSRFQA